MHHWCSANLKQFYPLYASIIFLETEVKILGLGCETKHGLVHRCKVNKAYKLVLYMSKQSINFKNAETSWFRGLFLYFRTKKMISVPQDMAFVSVKTDFVCYKHRWTSHPLFLMKNIKLNGIQTKTK